MAEDKKLGASGFALGACGGCALILIIGIIFLYVAFTKTGLVGKAQDIPEPSRVVTVGDTTADSIQSDITASVLRSFRNGQAQIEISERMLTSMLRSDLADAVDQGGVDFSKAQVVIIDGQLEFYLPFETDNKSTAVIMLITPTLTDGMIHLELTETRLGRLKIPGFIMQVLEDLINEAVARQLSAFEESFELTSLTFNEGSMVLSGKVSLDAIPGF